ncbi:M23 family metallopeptidase [Pyxidicoccus xibeiensis]|uniref:M23 family metallopeptidase n=1 Tax=Pyxidicoccus xibeiensis TaxID=2906759 RepID=UPI0020A785A9|nr:M23 family metallopeptidase [Pyxidicoccus xibeiensis]MCP3142997.1 M23 family metallopeptidase [Pyxidicoccus xibeiensis]
MDSYEFPDEIKKKAQEWHVIKVPLLGQKIDSDQPADWCGRTSASMVYNYFQLIKGGDPRERYITHSRAGIPSNMLDLRYPTGDRAFFEHFADAPQQGRGWNTFPKGNYEVTSDAGDKLDGELPVPLGELLIKDHDKRPKGLGGVLRYRSTPDDAAVEGRLLPSGLRDAADEIAGDEDAIRARFAHILKCLRANNPVVIYTGLGTPSPRFERPLHIIVICGYCILKTGGKSQLWLVTADPSSKWKLVNQRLLSAPNPEGNCDLGHALSSVHDLFRIQSGAFPKGDKQLEGFASFNLVRGGAFFKVNPTTQGTNNNRFLDHKDRPGGYYVYRERQTQAPAELIDSSFNRPKYSFPLRGNNASSHPWQCYYNNESLDTGIGGYYVLGLQRNLHGGVHLFPPAGQDSTPVSAIAPGYVVAARLPGEQASCLAPGVAEALGNWPGFVLVRHELEERPREDEAQAQGRRGAFYTLYMHLRSPAFPPELLDTQSGDTSSQKPPDTGALDRYLQHVPWFRELYKRRFGAWVNVSEVKDIRLGSLLWSLEQVTDADQKPPAGGAQSVKTYRALAEDGSTKPITVPGEKDTVQWLYKGPPGNMVEALKALARGEVVTFEEPFFPVSAGEVLGFVGHLPKDALPSVTFPVRPTEDVPTRRKQFTLRSGFLHFQVFCPEDDKENGIKLLTELAARLDTAGDKAPAFFDVKEDQEDNFLDVKEIEKHLKGALPREDQEPFVQATSALFAAASEIPRSSMGYGPGVAALLDSKTSFAPEAEKPDWISPCCRFAYPLKLEVETLYLPSPDQNSMVTGGSYELELCFEQELPGGGWHRMACPQGGCGGEQNGRKVCKPAVVKIDANKLQAAQKGIVPLSLRVPALADRMTLKAKQGFFIEQSVSLPGADGRLLAQGITRRWRNVRLIQKNEWTPNSVKAVLRKVSEAFGPDHPKPAEDTVAEIAWCDPKKETHIGRIPSLRTGQDAESDEPAPPDAKLFTAEGLLPPGSRLENLHPVTAVWLLNVLEKQNKGRVRDEWAAPPFRHEDPRPLGSGWMKKAGARLVGETAVAIVIDEDFGYDKQNRVTLLARQEKHVLALARGREFSPGGNIVQEVPAAFWGDWTLEVADTSEPPQTLEPKSKLPFLDSVITIPRPKLLGEQAAGEPVVIEQPQRQSDGSWRWLLQFEEPAPLALPAFVLLRTRLGQEGPTQPYSERVIPVTARPLTGATVPPVDKSHFKLDEGEDFIIGLKEDGKKLWEEKDKTLYVVKDLIRFKPCFEVMDIQVGWALVKGLSALKAKRLKVNLTELFPDGMKCVLGNTDDPSLYQVPGATVKPLGPETLELTFTPTPCDDPKLQALWVFDEPRERILAPRRAAAKASLGPFSFLAYQQLYRQKRPLHLHLSLAAVLAEVATALKGHPVIERIEASGLSCIINAPKKGEADRVRAAAASGGFTVELADPAQKTRLRLTANPASKNWLAVSFHPGPIFNSLMKGDLAPGVELSYWFELAALNGQSQLHFFGGETTGEGDGSITLAEFEALAARTSQHIRATHAEPGSYRKVAVRDVLPATGKEPAKQLAFKLSPTMGQCEVELTACLTGTPEDLNKYSAAFSRKLPGKDKFEPLQGFTKLRPDKLEIRGENAVADWLISARVPFPQPDGQKKSPRDGKTEFKLELTTLRADCEPQRLEVTGTYDFTPRWEGELTVEQKDGRLVLRCHGEGMEVPVAGAKDKRAWNVAREFVLVVKPDKADAHLDGVKPKLSENLEYATPTVDGKHGGCNLEGDFVATVELKALAPGVTYTFTLDRPLDGKGKRRPVRLTDLKPPESKTFTRTE